MYARYIKRLLDVAVSITAVIVLCPFILLTAVLIKIKLGAPVLFVQERPGRNERIFLLYKFRTMTNERDKNGVLMPEPARLTALGTFLRKYSVDELPELINIIKGDMSIIGPRPLLVKYLPYYTKEEHTRHSVRPGLSGLAQVSGRNNLSWDERFSLDVEYTKSISFFNDMRIFASTIFKVITAKHIIEPGLIEDFDVCRKKQNIHRDAPP
jgi:lipopolysaccharide/colanic/teichoic acid biosynthesis glycosyltransferase